ncbi:MAG TPA: DUF2339 domain-containing protein [Candidatus Baltobacteraceae bacterium]|nr:DUF2339 domain-containing protein [Candidatus Baltobacteraceae bacterium]
METTSFERLVPRIAAMQRELQSVRSALNEAIWNAHNEPEPPELPTAPPAAPEPIPESEAAAGQPIEEQPIEEQPLFDRDFENIFAGKWLNAGGLLLIFLGTAFFLKVAFDHNWIGPVMRVSMGIAGGAAIIAYAQMLANKGRRYFAEGLTALGAGIEFLALYASNSMFHLASPVMVLAGMLAVNAVLAAIAWRTKSERMAVLAALGGLFAPVLAGTGNQWMLVAYLAMLDTGLLLLNEILRSRFVAPLALCGTLAYGIVELAPAPQQTAFMHAAMFALLYVPFFSWSWVSARLRERLTDATLATSASALIATIIALESVLNPEHRAVLAAALVVLTGMHLAAAILLKSRPFSWTAAASLTCAIPAAFDHAMVNVGWAIEAALLGLAGGQRRDNVLRGAAVALIGFDIVADAARYLPYVQENPVWNERFVSVMAAAAATIAIARNGFADAVTDNEVGLVNTLRIASHALMLLAFGSEGWGIVQHFGGSGQLASAIVSVIGAAFAAVLIVSGLLKRDAMLRWEGLTLILVTAAKVFVLDLSLLDMAYRVISAVLVGLALTGVSYAYQRREKNGASS